MKKISIAIAAMSLVLALGCNQKSSTTTDNAQPASQQTAAAQNLTPEQLGEIGAAIKKHPSDAEKILTEHGLNMASFEKAIREVSSDPDASRRYRDAYNKAV
jgi:cytochrome c556